QAQAVYDLTLAEQAEQELGGPQQAAWLKRLEREHDNLRAALSWLLEQAGMIEVIEGEYNIELALRLGGALRSFWTVHGHISEGRNFLERALAVGVPFAHTRIKASAHAKALIVAANLAFVQSDYERAEPLFKASLAL